MTLKGSDAMKKILSKEPVRRALRTFFQTAVGYIAVNSVSADFTTKNAVIGFITAAVSAGIAAVMNLDINTNKEE